jgi:hypothetical protein
MHAYISTNLSDFEKEFQIYSLNIFHHNLGQYLNNILTTIIKANG